MNLKTEYEQDFQQWIEHHVTLLKEGRFNEIDAEHLIEELEDMGKSNLRELSNIITSLISHFLRGEYELNPEQKQFDRYTGRSWWGAILEQRIFLSNLLEDCPSSAQHLPDIIGKRYAAALKIASAGMDSSIFPSQCPYTVEQLLDKKFYPEPHTP